MTRPVPRRRWRPTTRAQFEDRWVRLAASGGKCVFLSGIDEMELPVAHGEGKFVPRDETVLKSLRDAGQLVLKYSANSRAGSSSTPISTLGGGDAPARAAVPYPDNPNGAVDDVAGICDATGRVFGLMPHPERFVDPTQHPKWTRGPQREVGDGPAYLPERGALLFLSWPAGIDSASFHASRPSSRRRQEQRRHVERCRENAERGHDQVDQEGQPQAHHSQRSAALRRRTAR